MPKKASKFAEFLDKKYIPLDRRAKMALAVLVVIVPVALFYFLFFQSTAKDITAKREEKQKIVDDIQKFKKVQQQIPAKLAAVDKARKEFELKALKLPKGSEIPQLLKDISSLGQNAGLDFLTFVPRGEVAKDFYNEIPVDITIRGPYHSVGFFFNQISYLDRIVAVSNINMGNPVKNQGEILLNSSCQLVTYRFTGVELPKDPNKKGK